MGDFGYPPQFQQVCEQEAPLNRSNIMINNDNNNDHHENSKTAEKLFVGGLSWETTEDSFVKYFSQYGQLVNFKIMKDKQFRRSRGFGFVTFADPVITDQVLEKDHVIDGRQVEVKKSIPKVEMAAKELFEKKKIFVGGMPFDLTEAELVDYFSKYGKVVEHKVMLDHVSGRSRGFAFVKFDTADAVERVLSEGIMHELGGKLVEIRRAEPRRRGGYNSAASARPKAHGSSGYDDMDQDYYSAYDSYDYYDGYGGSIPVNSAALYYYGAYGYGYGYANPMYNAGYGVGGYGIPGTHGVPVIIYGGINGLETGAPTGLGALESRGNVSVGGAFVNGRFHPYRR